MVYVVDASVAEKWFVEETFNDEASRLLNKSHELRALDFLLVGFDNVLVKSTRRKEMEVYKEYQILKAIRLFQYDFIISEHECGQVLILLTSSG